LRRAGKKRSGGEGERERDTREKYSRRKAEEKRRYKEEMREEKNRRRRE
jgi:hypothetical protein